KAIENILQERRILEGLDYPLICNLRYAFQDDEHIFMVLDLMLGGDLRFHLDRKGCIGEEAVRFYAVEIALSLRYLHGKRIIHRCVVLLAGHTLMDPSSVLPHLSSFILFVK